MFHLGGHEVEGVGAGGGEVFLEAGLIDEGHVGGEDIVGGLSVEDADEEGDHAFGDEGVGVGEVAHFAVLAGGVEPDLGLAAFDEAVPGLEVPGHGGEVFAEADDVFVAFGPVLEEAEFLEELLLGFGDRHGWWIGSIE